MAKRKELTLTKLEDKLQVLVNKSVRLRDGKVCISCGTTNATLQFHGGHYIARNVCPNLRYDPANIHSQCSRCNRFLSGNLIMYRYNLVAKIGLDEVEELELIARQYTKVKRTAKEVREYRETLNSIILAYKQKLLV